MHEHQNAIKPIISTLNKFKDNILKPNEPYMAGIGYVCLMKGTDPK